MGTSVSKVTNNDREDIPESKVPSTPIQAPQIRRLDFDPRSPSSDIARTPIEVLKTPLVRSAISSIDNSINTTEDLNISEEVPNIAMNLDPRSPTTEFHRTPIITDAIFKLQSMTLHNKNLDNARMPVVAITPVKPKRIPEKVSRKIYGSPETDAVKVIAPKLLESSPINVKPAENKRNSVVGLLETNIDFVETDLDVVIQNKNLKMLQLSLCSNQTPCETETIEPSPIIIEESVEEINSDITPEISEANVESECEIEVLAMEPQVLEVITSDSMEMSGETDKVPDTHDMLSVDELDRKLTNLIYEDKQFEVSPKVTKFVGNHRTPLGDRNSNSQQRRSIPILKVSDKPTKPSAAAISKIPVFKEKRVKGKMNVQCENTPPRTMTKRSQWSAEDSIII